MKINKEFIIKNLMTIICGIIVISLFMPFIGASASVNVGGFGADTGETTVNGFSIVTQGGFFGILILLCLVLIVLSAYVPQLKQYRKIVCAAASVIGLICTLIVPGMLSKSASASGGGVDASVKVSISHKIGFWIMLICFIALIAMSVIQFLGLKGNKVFDAINQNAELNNVPAGENNGNIMQNITSGAANAVGNIKEKFASHSAGNAQPSGQAVQPTLQAQTAQSAQVNLPQGNPEESMKRIKELFEMKEAGILTEEEFDDKKKELLKNI